MASDTFDVVVLGAGPAGEVVAGRARDHGLSVAVVEADLVGGECSYWACMPSKALLRPAQALTAALRTPGARQAVTGSVDVAAVLAHRDDLAHSWDDEAQLPWLERRDIELVRGHGRLRGERRVEVTAGDGEVTELHATAAVVVATGSVASLPPVAGLAESEPWDNRDATSAREVPSSLLVLGGGPVGAEMAQAYRRLGAAAVTIVEAEDRLLPGSEPEASAALTEAFVEDGIEIVTGAMADSVDRDGGGPVRLRLDSGRVVEAAEILVATGRRPRTEDIGLETIGMEPGERLDVDDALRVRAVEGGWLYAVGDVNERALLTHHGKYQARIAGDAIAGLPSVAWADHDAVVSVVFTDPEVASVGLSEREARQRGLDVATASADPTATAGAATHGDQPPGVAKLVVDQAREVIVGGTFVGPSAGEMIHALTIAIVGEVPLSRLEHAVAPYPTISEVWLLLVEEARGRQT